MMGKKLCVFLLLVQTASWVCETSRPFAPNHGPLLPPQGIISQSPCHLEVITTSKQVKVKVIGESEDELNGGVKKIGSSPPSCAHKCYGCEPCEATQVPTTSNRVGIEYANYEPEGWKCKCGLTFYSP